MITLSKKWYIIFISSSLFFGIEGMSKKDFKKEIQEKMLNDLKNELDKNLKGMYTLSGIELITKVLELYTKDSPASDLCIFDQDILPAVPLIIKTIKPIYQNLSPASKKFFSEVVTAITNVFNKRIEISTDTDEIDTLKKIIGDLKPINELIQNNRNAGIVTQFSLLDLSGKIIVGLSLPLALYGVYKATQTLMDKNDTQEKLQ